MRAAAGVIGFVILLVAVPARAGRTSYGWLPETDTVAASAFELGTSIYERDDLGPSHERASALLLTQAVGLTPNLELAIPVELVTRTADDAAPGSGIARYGAELRWRFLRRVPELRPLARFALYRDVAIQTQVRALVEPAVSYEWGRLQVEGAAGLVMDVNFAHAHTELRPGAGANLRVKGELRVGVEIYAQLSSDATATTWLVGGPGLAWARGTFWLSAVAGVGIVGLTAAPRLNLGYSW